MEYMETTINKCVTILSLLLCLIAAFSCAMAEDYDYAEYPLERAGIRLHLDCVTLADTKPDKHILLIHGVTYSSNEFDVDYLDYSLVRRLAREGYGVWRLDIAGFGQSGTVEDGFLPDSDYAAEDIRVAVEAITAQTGVDKIDVLGWSWGGMTTGRFAGMYPEHLRRLVLYAPVLSGIGEYEVSEDFHHNTWDHAVDDFQRNADGSFDQNVTDPIVIHVFCSNSWRYDGEYSPNGGRRDICVAQSEKLVDLEQITVPTLLICGDSDPYMSYDLINTALDSLPEGSELEIIKGGSHVVYIEEPYHCDFQNRLVSFLSAEEGADQSVMEIRIDTVRTGSCSMDYFRFGHGEQTLVILPGLSVQSVMGFADSVVDAYRPLAEDYTIYVFDRRRDIPEFYSVYDMARDTADAFRTLGLNQINLFGASQGGMMAQVIAIEQPDLIQKLVLGSTTARVDEAQFKLFEQWIQLARAGDSAGLYLAFGEAVYPQNVFEQSRALLKEAANTVTDVDLQRFTILSEGMKGFDITDALDRVACPTLVIGSKDDRVLDGEASAEIAERLGQRAELYMYDGYGHSAYDTAPDYKERLMRFLATEKATD